MLSQSGIMPASLKRERHIRVRQMAGGKHGGIGAMGNSKGRRKSRKWKAALAVAGSMLAVCFAAWIIYVGDYYHADDTAMEALCTGGDVAVEWLGDGVAVFRPEGAEAGLIFYPGGKVEFTAYAPLMRGLAEEGILCLLVRMPCNLAVLDMDAAEGLQGEFPEVGEWYMAGHSLGGAMAAGYAAGHADEYEGLVLLAAYPAVDISQSGLGALSVYGSEDGVLDMGKYNSSKSNLPADMEEHIIEGGCHAQFGSYGMQDGDGEPGIDGEEQRGITVRYIVEWIEGREK